MPLFSIDFGTSTTVLSQVGPDGPEVISLVSGGNELFKSDVFILPNGEFAAGDQPSGSKRGRSVKADELSEEWSKKVAAVLQEVVVRAGKVSNVDIKSQDSKIRMGCPASWGQDKRTALLDAAKKAGLNVYDNILTDEAVAVALPWLQANKSKVLPGEKLYVFDMGGGTTDLAIIKMQLEDATNELRPVVLASEALSVAGDSFDSAIAEIFIEKNKLSAATDLQASAETAKRQFKNSQSVTMEDPRFGKPTMISLDELSPALNRCFDEIQNCLAKAEFQAAALEPTLLTEDRVNALVRTYAVGRGIQSSPTDPPFDPLTDDGKKPVARDFFTMTSAHVAEAKTLAHGERDYSGSHVVLVGGMSMFSPVQEFVKKRFPGARVYLGAESIDNANPTAQAQQEFVARGLAEEVLAQGIKLDRPNFSLKLVSIETKKEIVIGSIIAPYESLLKPSESRKDGSDFGTPIEYQLMMESSLIRKVWRNVNIPTGQQALGKFGKLIAETPAGERIQLKFVDVAKETAFKKQHPDFVDDGLLVAFGMEDFRVILNPNGFFVVFDGMGQKWGLGAGFTGLPIREKNKPVLHVQRLAEPQGFGAETNGVYSRVPGRDERPSGNAGRI